MSETPTNPPAFPQSGQFGTPGMDLRDYLAAKALQGLLPARDPQGRTAFTEMGHDECAKAAYGLADAMLKAREVQS